MSRLSTKAGDSSPVQPQLRGVQRLAAQLRRAAALGVPGDLEPSQRQRHQHLGASPDSRNVVKEGITRAWRIWKDLATFDISLPFFSWGGWQMIFDGDLMRLTE